MTNDDLKQLYIDRIESRARRNETLYDISLVLVNPFIIYLAYSSESLWPIIFAGMSVLLTLISFLTFKKCVPLFLDIINEQFSHTPSTINLATWEQSLKFWDKLSLYINYASGILFAAALLTFIIELVV